jgi:tol-pal system protein YbgF
MMSGDTKFEAATTPTARSWSWRTACAGGMALAIFSMGAARAQNLDDNQGLFDRLNRIEQDLMDLQRDYYQNASRIDVAPQIADDGSVSDTVAARLSTKIDELDSTLRRLTGQVEEMNFKVQQATNSLTKLSGDIEYRLSALEQNAGTTQLSSGAPTNAQSTLPQVGSAPVSRDIQVAAGRVPGTLGTIPGTSGQGSAKSQYEAAFDLVYRGDVLGGQQALIQFLQQNPENEWAGHAQYWLGETYYARGDFRKAAAEFLTGVQKYRSSVKAPDSLLKLGMSLIKLGEKENGCGALGSISSEFPKVNKSVLNVASRERKNAGCG